MQMIFPVVHRRLKIEITEDEDADVDDVEITEDADANDEMFSDGTESSTSGGGYQRNG